MSTPLLLSSSIFWLLVVLFAAWAGFWKTIALWFSARNSEKAWFIVFALVSLAGIPEIYYLRSRACWPFKPKEPDEAPGRRHSASSNGGAHLRPGASSADNGNPLLALVYGLWNRIPVCCTFRYCYDVARKRAPNIHRILTKCPELLKEYPASPPGRFVPCMVFHTYADTICEATPHDVLGRADKNDKRGS